MAKEIPWFKFNVTEWMTGNIVYESLEVQGLFINICCLYWKNLGVLSEKNIEERFRKKTLISKLSGRFFSVTDGYISISFLDEQLSEKQIQSKINSINGSKGGKAKTKRTLSENDQTLSDGLANQSNIELERELEKELELEREEELDKGYSEFEILDKYSFDEFWELYDKKVERGACEKKFAKLTEKEKELIWAHVPIYVLSQPDKQYRKNPETYLNGKCWNDEIIKKNITNARQSGLTETEKAIERIKQRHSEASGQSERAG